MRNHKKSPLYQLALSLIALCTLFVLSGCETQRKLIERGKQQVEVGMIDEAGETFFRALEKGKNNVEAQLQLRNILSILYENKSQRISDAYRLGNASAVISTYQEIANMQKRAARLGIKTDIPLAAEEFFIQSRDLVNRQKNAQASIALQNKEFTTAHKLYNEILSIEPNNAEALKGIIIAQCEPIYLEATQYFEGQQFRGAHTRFSSILNYKNSKEMAEIALEKATRTYLFTPMDLNRPSTVQDLCNYLIKYSPSTYFKLITYGQASPQLREFGCGYEDLIRPNQRTAAVKDIAKIDYIVLISPLNNRLVRPTLTNKRYKGLNIETIETKDKNGLTVKKEVVSRVYYTVVSTATEQSVSAAHLLRIIDPVHGNQVLEKEFIRHKNDRISYIEYDGNIKNLYAGTWSKDKEERYPSFHEESRQLSSLRSSSRRAFRDPNSELTQAINELYQEIRNQFTLLTQND